MALAHVQDSTALVHGSGSPLTSTLTFGSNITAGNTVYVFDTLQGSSARTFTVSDNIVGNYNLTQDHNFIELSGEQSKSQIWSYPNHPGGAVTITVTHGSGSANFAASAAEFSGFGATLTVQATDKYTDPAVDTNHRGSDLGITYGSECVAFILGATSGPNFTNAVPSTGYAKIPAGFTDGDHMIGYKLFPSGATAELGAYTTTGTARQMTSRLALISEGAPPPSTFESWVCLVS